MKDKDARTSTSVSVAYLHVGSVLTMHNVPFSRASAIHQPLSLQVKLFRRDEFGPAQSASALSTVVLTELFGASWRAVEGSLTKSLSGEEVGRSRLSYILDLEFVFYQAEGYTSQMCRCR